MSHSLLNQCHNFCLCVCVGVCVWVWVWVGGWVGVCVLQSVRSQDPRGRDWLSKREAPRLPKLRSGRNRPPLSLSKLIKFMGGKDCGFVAAEGRQGWCVGTRGSCCP